MKSIKYITTVLAASLLSGFGSYAQDYSANIFEGHADVGSCALKGDLQFVPQTQEYILTGSGDNIWFAQTSSILHGKS
jgi:TolB protein